jgi:hypothetical protein
LAGGSQPSRHGCRAPQALSTGTRLGGPGGADAGPAFVTVSVSSASVRCPVRADSVHACLSTRPLSAVQCPGGRLSVQVSGVRCPAWVSGVRAFPCPLCPTERSWRVAVGQAAAWLGWPGSAWSPAVSATGSSSARFGTWRSRLAQAMLGQRRRRLGLGRRRGRWLGSGEVDRVGDQARPDVREDRPLVASRGA